MCLIEKARSASLEGDYESALAIVDALLADNPANTEALRLKGNTIELKILACTWPISVESRAAEIAAASRCYQLLLKQNPRDLLALRDLADHCRNFGSKDEARALYFELINLLRDALQNGEDVTEELDEVVEEYSALEQE